MMSILITGAADAAAYRLERKLQYTGAVYLADHVPLPSSPFNSKKFIQIPPGTSNTFIHQLLTICLDYAIDTVYPLRKSELLPLAEAANLFIEYGIDIIVPSPDTLILI